MSRWPPKSPSYQPSASGVGRPRTDGGWRMPCGTLPRSVPMHPEHVPSTVVFFVQVGRPSVTSFGARRPAPWRRVARVECSCGWGWGRTTVAGPGDRETDLPVRLRSGMDDVQVRGGHTTHTYLVWAREKAA